MGFIKESDVQRLTQDQALMAEVAQAVVSDPESMEDLADEIADKLESELEDNVDLRRQIVDAAVASPEFKKKIVTKLAQELND